MIREYIKRTVILCTVICCVMMVYGGRSYAMELNEEERKEEEESRQRAAEYEMNMILDMLDVKEWNWPSWSKDAIDFPEYFPKDAPLGSYSPEALAEYVDDGEKMEVEIDYYYGGFQPQMGKETVQIYKIYKDDRQHNIGYVVWAFGGNTVEDYQSVRRDETGWKEGDGVEKGEPLSCEKKPAMLAMILQRMAYKEKLELTPDNIDEVMETFLMIKNEKDFLRLGRLPLTGRFLNECIDGFPYLENIRDMRQFRVRFWGIGENGKIICQCILAPSTEGLIGHADEQYRYLVEMKLEDGQIDDMEIILEKAYEEAE